ncbi:nuclear transport factor 2 family protein [Mycobacterium simiae]|uniref:Nuclear transport factor 2 family protein n=1 Tax=Mycobacterium simiae TaxID=1784 RepID=A0A5B1BIJ7_MYCSI|nr:nuclear transport factor 2 family protein [Mycobacterium simiae]KAA1248477.1 nuclear transport factor 2 family protein [Mycobacterium simiae]
MSVALLREMFDQMVVAKNAALIEHYYDPDFRLYSDGLTQTLAEFSASHRKLYATAIAYAIEYDEQAWVEATDKVAGRVWITTNRPGENPARIEIVLIAAYRHGKIHRLWETTWPSWRNLAAMENYSSTAS